MGLGVRVFGATIISRGNNRKENGDYFSGLFRV